MSKVTHTDVLKFVWRYARQHLVLLCCMVVVLLLSTALQLIQPFFYKEVVDTIASSNIRDSAALSYAVRMVILGALFGAVHLLLHELAARMLGWIETRIMHRAHSDVYAHVQRLSTQFHVNAFAGATSRKIGRGTDAIETIMDRTWFNFLPLMIMTVGFMLILSFFAPLIGLAIVGGILVYAPVSIALNLYMARYHSWTDQQDTHVTASLVDSITGNAVVKAFGAEEREEARHGKVLTEWQSRLWTTWKLGNIVTWTQFMLLIVIELALMLLSVYLWYRGEFTPGSFIVVTIYIGRLWGFLYDIGQNVRNYLRAVAHAEEMIGLAQMPLGVADAPNAPPLSVPQGSIAFEDVSFGYENKVSRVFDHFSVAIQPGERVALVGHSGGGKSTFVKLLLRLYDVTEGRITIDGQNIDVVTQESLRTSIGLVPQDPILFHRSIAENIRYAKSNATQDEIIEAAKHAHAHEFIQDLPFGYDTLVGERGVKLSGGERQRVAIARAIIADTPILILDEATSSLDSQSEKYIQDALHYLMQGRTTIVIAHRLSTIKQADRILVIEDGRIVEQGPHSELVKKEGGLYRDFYELQAGGFIGE
ncbi:MAG: ABC transporter ATP-binding protein [Candidatus Peregrinibacteria bacterium]|nr:ABC transporter ATP-binding protein [Candidatus Peregrinibacteria bacterium]